MKHDDNYTVINAVILTEDIDSDNQKILVTSVGNTKVPIYLDFDRSRCVGQCSQTYFIAGEKILYGKLKIFNSINYKGLYPAIGFQTIEKEQKDGYEQINKLKLFSIGLSSVHNANSNVLPL